MEPLAGRPPLAARMRPRALDEVAGQQHLLAPGKGLRVSIEAGDTGSILFWGLTDRYSWIPGETRQPDP